jgi:hypothetical protein
MPSKQEEPDPDIDFLRTFVSERARLQAEQLAGQKADQAALEEPDPAQRQLAPLFEPDQSQPAPPTPPPAADRTPEPVTSFEPPPRTPWTWLLIVSALTLALGLAAGSLWAPAAQMRNRQACRRLARPQPSRPPPLQHRLSSNAPRPRPALRPRAGPTRSSSCSLPTSAKGLLICSWLMAWQVDNAAGTHPHEQAHLGRGRSRCSSQVAFRGVAGDRQWLPDGHDAVSSGTSCR